jgi:hypothetical protein
MGLSFSSSSHSRLHSFIYTLIARRIYRVSAYLSIALLLWWWIVLYVGGVPTLLAPVARLLVFAGVWEPELR